MTLPPAEKSPIVLLHWTRKANDNPDLVQKIKALFRDNKLLLLPIPGNDTTILAATQVDLEQQAQDDHLVKRRRIAGPSSIETVMDYFTLDKRADFCRIDNNTSCEKDSEGLFTVYERRHLLLGILESISVSDERLFEELAEDPKKQGNSTNLRYLLESHGWVDTLAPLHVETEKARIQRTTCYPLSRILPPVQDIEAYYGPEIAYCKLFESQIDAASCL